MRYESNKNKLKINGRYTIGKVTRVFGMRGGKACSYEFVIGNTKYKASDYTGGYNPDFERYLIIFYSKDPEINYIILGAKIPDTIKQSPSYGWKDPPFKVNKEIIDNAIH